MALPAVLAVVAYTGWCRCCCPRAVVVFDLRGTDYAAYVAIKAKKEKGTRHQALVLERVLQQGDMKHKAGTGFHEEWFVALCKIDAYSHALCQTGAVRVHDE